MRNDVEAPVGGYDFNKFNIFIVSENVVLFKSFWEIAFEFLDFFPEELRTFFSRVLILFSSLSFFIICFYLFFINYLLLFKLYL